MASSRSYDLVILGATGFTGKFVLEEVSHGTVCPGGGESRYSLFLV